MSFWDNLQRHGSSTWKTAERLNLDERNNVNSEISNLPRLNMNHGFMKSIVRNQIHRYILFLNIYTLLLLVNLLQPLLVDKIIDERQYVTHPSRAFVRHESEIMFKLHK